jgi:hypothetical protein
MPQNRDRNQLQARLGQERSKIGRQIRSLLEMIKEGYGTPALAQELRSLEQTPRRGRRANGGHYNAANPAGAAPEFT